VTGERLFIGVDLGRSTRLALVDEAGRIVGQRRTTTILTSPRELVDGLIAGIRSFVSEALPYGTIAGIGVGLPGLVDRTTNKVVMLPNLLDVSSIDLHGELERATGLPVVFDNDANAATYGEWQCGAARGATDFVLVALGTGIGAGIVQGGVLQRGKRGFAGELGHLKVMADGLECSCGSSGCLETVASGPNIVRRTRERLFEDPVSGQTSLAEKMRGKVACEDVVEGAEEGDPLARSILAETGLFLGMTIANVVNMLNVELVVLAGPVMRGNHVLLASALEETARRAFGPSYSTCRVVASELGDDAGVIGSAMMARDEIDASRASEARR
jgi:glucokinase